MIWYFYQIFGIFNWVCENFYRNWRVKVLGIKIYKRWSSFLWSTFLLWYSTSKPLNNVGYALSIISTCCWGIALLILSSSDLLILAISGLDGLISLNDNLWEKLSLWFLTVMKASVSYIFCNLLSIFNFSQRVSAS